MAVKTIGYIIHANIYGYKYNEYIPALIWCIYCIFVLNNDVTPDLLQNQADAELRVCGFRVKVGEVKFEEDNQVLFARVWWQ